MCTAFYGYNTNSPASFDLFNGGLETVSYIVVPNEATCGPRPGFAGVSQTLSHEIIEAVTDPGNSFGQSDGWKDRNQSAQCGVQVADICDLEPTVINSWIPNSSNVYTATVQKIWSQQAQACVTEDNPTAPTATGISPASGPAGTAVTITGTNFEGFPTVLFGNTPAFPVSCTSTACTLSAPALGQGTVPVTIALNDFTLLAGQFTYSLTTNCVYFAQNDDGNPDASQPSGSMAAECAPDSAGDPIYIFEQSSTGGWTPFFDYAPPPYGGGGADIMRTGLPDGTNGTKPLWPDLRVRDVRER